MSQSFKSIPHQNAFDVLRNQSGVLLTEFETARVSTALQGASTLIAVLQQREIDVDLDSERLTFDSAVAQGLLSALAVCVEYTSDIVGTGGAMGQRADYDEPEYQHLESARMAIINAKHKAPDRA